eukprot:scaffold1231_cov69-Phaeocystis_antarctica.AAC.2
MDMATVRHSKSASAQTGRAAAGIISRLPPPEREGGSSEGSRHGRIMRPCRISLQMRTAQPRRYFRLSLARPGATTRVSSFLPARAACTIFLEYGFFKPVLPFFYPFYALRAAAASAAAADAHSEGVTHSTSPVEAHIIVQQEREAEDELRARREHRRRGAAKASQARRRTAHRTTRRTARALLGATAVREGEQ